MTMQISTEQTKRRSELLQDLIDAIAYELQQFNISEQQANERAKVIAFKIHERWRGLTVIFPMRPDIVIENLKRKVLAEFTGNNFVELVRKYGVAENTIYQWRLEELEAQTKKANEAQRQLDI